MSEDVVARVRYFDRQYLRKQDLVDEQAYHLAMRRRHNIAHHTWGIVHGLDLVVTEGNLFLEPGLAVDGYGRELVVPAKRALSLAGQRSDLLDVRLLYERRPASPSPWADPCAQARPAYRWLEEPTVLLKPAVDPVPRARFPSEVPAGDNPFPPQRTPPDDPDHEWPVFLGRVRLVRSGLEVKLELDPRGRPYAGLVGEEVRAPGGGARLELGGEGGRPRFAVHAPVAGKSAGAEPPRLEIDSGGEIALRGRASIEGGLRLEGGALELTPAPSEPLEEGPRPWQIYLQESATGERELRIEMAAGGDAPQRVVVGSWSDEKSAFQPILSIAEDRTVTVEGDLVVEGLLLRVPPDEGPPISPDAERLLLNSFLAGLTSGPPPAPGGVAGVVTGAKNIVQTLVEQLGDNPRSLDELAERLQEQKPQLLRPFLERLKGLVGG